MVCYYVLDKRMYTYGVWMFVLDGFRYSTSLYWVDLYIS